MMVVGLFTNLNFTVFFPWLSIINIAAKEMNMPKVACGSYAEMFRYICSYVFQIVWQPCDFHEPC